MAVYLARSCPRCRDYFGVVIAETQGHAKPQSIHGRCATKSTGRVEGKEMHMTLSDGYKVNWDLQQDVNKMREGLIRFSPEAMKSSESPTTERSKAVGN